jgi:hypothetical protein
MTRPPLIQSAVDNAFAITIGCCSGKIVTHEFTRMRCVAPATNACATVECKKCGRDNSKCECGTTKCSGMEIMS